MGSAISSLAFPAPELDLDFYKTELQERPDFCYLVTRKGERIPAIHRQASPDAFTILYSHGNAEDLGLMHDFVDVLASETKASVLAYDYVGYSLSRLEGASPSEGGALDSIDACWKYLTEEQSVPPERIVLFGRSIGSGPTVDLASRAEVAGCMASPHDIAGVLLSSPLESGARAILGKIPSIIGYPLDIFRNYQKIGLIPVPVAIMHGTEDAVVPCANGRALHAALQRPHEPLWVEGKGHNNISWAVTTKYAQSFLESLRAQQQ